MRPTYHFIANIKRVLLPDVSIATLRCGRPTLQSLLECKDKTCGFQSQLCDAADLPDEILVEQRKSDVSIATLRCGRPTNVTMCVSSAHVPSFNRNSAMRPTYRSSP